MSNIAYQFSVPQILRGFEILSSYIELARRHAEAKGLAEADILNARLAPDMLPFAGQIQRASDKAKGGVSRLATLSAPPYADNEKTFAELQQRINKTVDFIKSADPAKFEGAEDRTVELRFKSVNGEMTGHTYLTQVLMPDFYFHIATAHGILRSLGVSIGKANFIGVPDYLHN